MSVPTTAPVYDIQVGGATRKFYMGFRAFKKLGLNPFEQAGLGEYLKEPDVDKICALLQAGIENAVIAKHDTGTVPTVEELIDVMDGQQFMAIMATMSKVKSEQPKPDTDPSDPPSVQTGTQSGQLAATT